jgi:phage replication O-like protein O
MAKPELENGHVKIANELVEALAKYNFSAYETRLLWVILRKTYGWSKKTDRISYTQFEEASGIDRRHIARAINSLKERGVITCTGSGYQLEYGIQKDYDKWDLTPKEATIIDTKQGNDLTPKEATIDQNKSLPIQGESLPIQGDLTPKEATKSLPKEANTKAIKHSTKAITKASPTIPLWINPNIWNAFLEMRKKMKAPPTDFAITCLIKDLTKFKASGDDPNAVLEQSITNNWKGVFFLKNKGTGNGPTGKGVYHGTNAAYKPQPPGTSTTPHGIDGDAEAPSNKN